MSEGQRILVLDSETDTEEVLRAVLEPRGHSVSRPQNASELAAAQTSLPDVMVIRQSKSKSHSGETAAMGWNGVPRVVIGSLAMKDSANIESNNKQEFLLNDPFQYGELFRAIESLLGDA